MKKLRLIFTALCICLLLVPMTVQATEVTSDFFTIDLDVKDHGMIGPGDIFTETFTIDNTAKSQIKVRLYDVDNKGDSKLYPVIKARWHNQEKEVAFIELDKMDSDWYTINAGKELDLKLEMYFPAECGNEYEGADFAARFIFEARIPEQAVGDYDGPGFSSNSDTPQTGDSFNPLVFAGLATASGCVLLILLWAEKRRKSKQT